MTLVIPIHFAELSFQVTHNSDPDPWYITIGVEWDLVDGTTPLVALGAARDAYAANMLDILTEDATFTGVQGKFGQDGDALTIFLPTSDPGHASDDFLPQNCAALCTKVTGLGGRKGKGRFYLPGVLPEDQVNAVGTISGTYQTTLQAAVDGFGLNLLEGTPGGEFPDVGMQPVLLHNDYGIDTPEPTEITVVTVQPIIATQRRRLR